MFSHLGHVMTLANSIIGVGILAMPFCFQRCGIILAIVLLILSNWITRICCHYLIKCSLLTRRKSFEFLGLHAFGPSGKLLAELCIIGYLVGTCITYFVVVGDLGPQIIAKLFALEIEYHRHLRTLVMTVVTILCILPLGMLRNVDSLSTLCAASIGFYICLILKVVFESKPHIIAKDWTDKVVYWEPAGILQCLPIFSMALSCQMQLFEVFESINNQSLEKLNGIVRNALWICTFVYIAVGFFGYVAFCTQTFSGNILTNLTPSFSSDVIKIGFVFSIAFSFPLVIFPCRASIYSLLYRKGLSDSNSYIPEPRFRAITIFIIGASLCVAIMIPSVELIIGLVGSTIGVAICIMFPASSFRKIIKKESTERMLAQFIFFGGFCLMILGTFANLNAINAESSGAHFELLAANAQMSTPAIDHKMEMEIHFKNAESIDIKKLLELTTPKNSNRQAKQEENLLKILKQTSEKPPLPPLPVEEIQIHKADAETVINKLNLKTDDKQAAQKVATLMKIEKKPEVKLNDSWHMAVIEKVKQTLSRPNMNQTATQQSIDNAVKKDVKIAAEDQKENKYSNDNNHKNNNNKNQNEYEFKKTQNELKKTKELLERTVDELKEELNKHNLQTQYLVVEKLGKVVEKVEQIERKVQNKEVAERPDLNTMASSELQMEAKGSALINMLSSSVQMSEQQQQQQVSHAHAGIYEPLSYQNAAVTNNNSGIAVNSHLPLPLALLKNITAAKNVDDMLVKPMESILLNETQNENNVEAIRRDILQLKNLKVNKTVTEIILPTRTKREITNATEGFQNCLIEPKLNVLPMGGAAEFVYKIENTGRELKAITEEQQQDETTTTSVNDKG